ncbi:PKD domain-containing protein [Algoriphagus sp.]|uniref:PKD domain-containing protein n=1 Tax=Algoriphagus sp. TaxID=1872435 RepID=UPI003F709F4F
MFKIETHLLHLKYLLLFLGLVIFQLSGYQSSYGQFIPRAGFPYCQGFLNLPSEDPNSIQFTVAKGDKVIYGNPITFEPRQIRFTGNGIRLVESEEDLRGYLFIDLPFSPTYGIKTSFEYFIHTPNPDGGAGDGFSFFLFDGNVNASTFEIGGVGGSLGYAPHGSNGNVSNPNPVNTSGGLKGGYMGIGFDAVGNFGNFQEKKYGGFHNPNQFNSSTPFETDRKWYPDAVTIRGPVRPGDTNRDNGFPTSNTLNPLYDSYQFVDGKITHFDPTESYPPPFPPYGGPRIANGSGDLYSTSPNFFLPSSEMFELSTGLDPSSQNINCGARPLGYRKVFIDLEPTNNPAVPYRISVSMLKDNDVDVTPVLVNVPYPYPIPAGVQFLKLGFAASTGNPLYSAIDIRNVAALVSSVDELKKPDPDELFREICIEDEEAVEFPFCVSLADENTFIQCIQLMDDFEPADNNFDDDFFNCEMPGFCDQRCVEGKKVLPVIINGNEVGVFRAELSEEVEVGKFNEANITFERTDLNFYGTITKFYKVVDNFGLESDAIPITVTINPRPQITAKGESINPTCDGQNDGSLTGVVISNLADDFIVSFTNEEGDELSYTLVSNVVGSDGYSTATFDLEGLNLGKIYVTVENPNSNSLGPVCDINDDVSSERCIVNDELLYEFDQVRGTPVLVDPDEVDICEGNDAVLTPTIHPKYGSNPGFIWYTDKDRSQRITAATTSIDGESVIVTIDTDGVLTISGLTAGGASSKTYDFFVETASPENGDDVGDFCPYPGDVLSKAEITVYPAISANVVVEGDWCLQNSGSITVTAEGGNGGKTFTLLDSDGNTVGSSNSTGVFTGLSPDEYVVEISSNNPPCDTPIATPVEGPDNELELTPASDPAEEYCDLSNGSIAFSLTGGNLPYNSITINGADINTFSPDINGNTYTLNGLEGGNYLIEVVDDKACTAAINMIVPYEEPSEFKVTNDEICEGQEGTVQAVVVNQSSSTPTFNWFVADGAGSYTPISDGQLIDGATFSVNTATQELTVNGLTAQTDPYVYYLQVTGNKVCNTAYLPAEIQVNSGPEMDNPDIRMVECFGGDQGAIQAVIPSGNLADYEFRLVGDNGVDIPFTANKGLFENLTRGIYTLTIRNADGCTTNTDELEVTEPDEMEVLNPSSINPTCGRDNGEIVFEIGGGTPGYTVSLNGQPISTYSFSQQGDVYSVKNLAPDTYSVTVVDDNSCSLTMPDLFTLTNDAGIDVSIDPIEEEYCEAQIAKLVPVFQSTPTTTPTIKWYKDEELTELISLGADAELTYQINPATGGLEIEGLAAGAYSYFVEITGAGICTSVNEAKVTINEPIVSILDISAETCFQSEDGSITVNSTGGSGDYEYSLNSGSFVSTNVFSGLASGTYSIIVRDDLGCEESISAEVEGPASPLTINTPDLLRSSCGLENGSIENLVISGGWGNYSVEWRKGSATGTVIPGDESKTMNLGPDLYFLVITDSGECSEVFEFEIEEASDPEYQLVQPIDACSGTPVTISPVHLAPDPTEPPVAFTEVSWYKNSGQSGLIANGADGSNPNITYTIDDSDWLNPSLTIEGLSAGTHNYYFYVACTGQEIPVEVSVFDTPAVELNTTPVTCFGDVDGRVQITSGGLPEYVYSIDGRPDMDQTALENTSFDAGSYVLVVSTPAGCAQTVNFEIEGPDAALTVSTLAGINPGCGAANGKLDFTVSGGYVPYTIGVMKDGLPHLTQTSTDQQIKIDGQRPGVYSVTITDSQGCSVTTNSVTLVDGPTQVLVDDQEICEGDQAVLLPSIDPNIPGAVYGWFFDAAQTQPIISSINPASDGNIYEINPSNGQLTIIGLTSSVSPFKLFVSASGNGICGGFVADPTVSVYTTPTATASVEDEICYGDGGTITVSASGGSGNYTFSLDGGAFVNDPVFSNVPTGTHTVVINTEEGCNFDLENIIITGPSATLAVSNIHQVNPSCDLQNGEISFDITGGYPDYTVSYSFNGGAVVSQPFVAGDPVLISGLEAGQYEFSITDSEGCKISLPAPINFVNEPTVISSEDQEICIGETATLTPSVPSNIHNPQFEWFFDAQENSPITSDSQGNITYTVHSNGSLDIQGLDPAGSPYSYYVTALGTGICNVIPKEVKVEVFDVPTLRVSNPSIVCDPTGTVDLTDYIEGYNPSVYDYNVLSPGGNAMQLGELESVNESGDYRVSSSVKGSSCWNGQQRIRVIIAEQLLEAEFQYEADLGDGTMVPNGDIQILQDVQFSDLTRGNAVIWNWDFGDGFKSSEENPVHQFQSKGSFTIKLVAIDDIGCKSEYQLIVNVFDDYLIMIPNAFTPTGSKNQYFKPQYRGIRSMEFYIFNTWGELIYKAESLEDLGWDGMVKGEPAIPGNYVYRGIFTSVSGEVIEKAGTFVLIR